MFETMPLFMSMFNNKLVQINPNLFLLEDIQTKTIKINL
jgi:hypothetical protein